MTTTSKALFSIGELAKQTGVAVKTIRFYSDQGILPPSDITAAGYRRYSDDDVTRLETIRTLRAAGFDIATIREMLDQHRSSHDAIRIQIEALEIQERTLRRQRAMLERALTQEDGRINPERSRALALLSSAERSAFLRNHIEAGIDHINVDGVWLHDFLNAAVADIPDELDDDQLAAWIELAEMIDDPSFAEAIRRTAEPFWERFVGSEGFSLSEWQSRQQSFVAQVREALQAGVAPDSQEGIALIASWRDSLGPLGNDVLRHMIETHDSRLARYWQLIACVNGLPWDRELDQAWRWILTAAEVLQDG